MNHTHVTAWRVPAMLVTPGTNRCTTDPNGSVNVRVRVSVGGSDGGSVYS